MNSPKSWIYTNFESFEAQNELLLTIFSQKFLGQFENGKNQKFQFQLY